MTRIHLKQWFRQNGPRILLVVLLAGSLAFISNYVFDQSHVRPVVAYKPGSHVIWIQNASERFSKDAQVALPPPVNQTSLDLYLAKNEYEAFQVIIRPLKGILNDVSFGVSPLVLDGNPSEQINESAVEIRYIEPVIDGEYPEILKPLTYTPLIEGNKNYGFWMSVRTPLEMVAGLYRGLVTISFDGHSQASFSLNLHVWNFTISPVRHVRTVVHPWEGYSKLLSSYQQHRINPTGPGIWQDVTAFWNPSTSQWSFDWVSWDAQISAYLADNNNCFMINGPCGFPRNPNLTDTAWLNQTLGYYQGVGQYLKDKNWTKYAYLYFIDEPQMFVPAGMTVQDYFNKLANIMRLLKEFAPDVRIMCTTAPNANSAPLFPYLDIWCPLSSDYDATAWQERIDTGKEMWFYPCVAPTAPWPNVQLYSRLYEIRILMWQVFLYRGHGFLHWSSSAPYHGGYGLACNGWGDGWFHFQDAAGNWYDSCRWEMFLQGQEDYEYLWLLNSTYQYLIDHDLTSVAGSCASQINQLVNSITTGRYSYTQSPTTLYQTRFQIGAMLDGMSSYANLTEISLQPMSILR